MTNQANTMEENMSDPHEGGDEMVVHPKHYNSHESGVEVITVIREMNYPNIANAFKYVTRYKHKGNPIQDLEKAVFYIDDFRKKPVRDGILERSSPNDGHVPSYETFYVYVNKEPDPYLRNILIDLWTADKMHWADACGVLGRVSKQLWEHMINPMRAREYAAVEKAQAEAEAVAAENMPLGQGEAREDFSAVMGTSIEHFFEGTSSGKIDIESGRVQTELWHDITKVSYTPDAMTYDLDIRNVGTLRLGSGAYIKFRERKSLFAAHEFVKPEPSLMEFKTNGAALRIWGSRVEDASILEMLLHDPETDEKTWHRVTSIEGGPGGMAIIKGENLPYATVGRTKTVTVRMPEDYADIRVNTQ